MKKNSHSLRSLFPCACLAVPLLLSACGGGGSSTSASTDGSANADAMAAPLVEYASGCVPNAFRNKSESFTLKVSPSLGSGPANFTFTGKGYLQADCADGNVITDITVRGVATPTGATKVITPAAALAAVESDGLNKSGTATLVNAAISGVTFAKWSSSIPSNLSSAKVGYLLEGNRIYVLIDATNQSDGVGAYFSPVTLVKQ